MAKMVQTNNAHDLRTFVRTRSHTHTHTHTHTHINAHALGLARAHALTHKYNKFSLLKYKANAQYKPSCRGHGYLALAELSRLAD